MAPKWSILAHDMLYHDLKYTLQLLCPSSKSQCPHLLDRPRNASLTSGRFPRDNVYARATHMKDTVFCWKCGFYYPAKFREGYDFPSRKLGKCHERCWGRPLCAENIHAKPVPGCDLKPQSSMSAHWSWGRTSYSFTTSNTPRSPRLFQGKANGNPVFIMVGRFLPRWLQESKRIIDL